MTRLMPLSRSTNTTLMFARILPSERLPTLDAGRVEILGLRSVFWEMALGKTRCGNEWTATSKIGSTRHPTRVIGNISLDAYDPIVLMKSFHLSGFGRRYDIPWYTLVIDKFRRGRRGCGSTWSDGHSGLRALFLSTTELEAIRIIPDHYIILVTRRRGLSTVRDLLRVWASANTVLSELM